MESYKYHGITSLNSFQKDRAIEQIASHHERLSRRFAEIGRANRVGRRPQRLVPGRRR